MDEIPDSEAAIAANKAAWDATAPHHRNNAAWRALAAGFATPGYSCFDAVMHEVLTEIGLSDKAVAQICCNNGRETISLRNLGAAEAVGFDQSAAFLEQARELNALAQQDCTFVEADANALPPAYAGHFDLVVITIGVFGWMPDLDRFMVEAAKLLRPSGEMLVHEEHPVVNMFEPRGPAPLKVAHSYFRDRPFISSEAILYDDAPRPEVPRHYWFVHPLGSIFGALLRAGLAIRSFREFPHNISSTEFDRLETAEALLPMSYLLRASKE
jgi:SAM-dependent methyltransferase